MTKNWNTITILYTRIEDPTETAESLAHDQRANLMLGIVQFMENLGIPTEDIDPIIQEIQKLEFENRK